jgi:hypothetical protein
MYIAVADVTATRLHAFLGKTAMIKFEIMSAGKAPQANPVSKLENATVFQTKKEAIAALKNATKSTFDLANFRVKKIG